MGDYAVAVVGRDQPGIAAALANALLAANANIEDSRMTILGGQFAVMMLVSLPEGADVDGLQNDLDGVREQLGLETAALRAIEDASSAARPQSTHLLTVYGADHSGIVAAVCEALADNSVNIDDLATRVVGSDEAPVYTLICELTLPASLAVAELSDDLDAVAVSQGVEVVLRELDQDIL
ncbi:MAG: glycine cleavage system protein R [Solirubrobacterales bacterium]